MANVATAIGTIPGGIRNLGLGCQTVMYKCTFDTTGAALTVHTPGAARLWAIVGLQYSEASAHKLTIISGTTSLTELEKAANSGVQAPLGEVFCCAGVAGEALKLQCDTAVVGMLIVYVQEIECLDFNRG
jgi:hypothetical protein